MTHDPDPLRDLADVVTRTEIDPGPGLTSIHRRATRRRRTRHAAVAGVTALCLGGAAFVVTAAPAERDVAVDTADVPAPPDDVPAFVDAELTAWTEWEVDGVIDRAGRDAPVFRRDGSGDDLVLVLGPSIPCVDRPSCALDRPTLPGDLGFLSERGPLGGARAVFVPSWTDDLHVGRATDVALTDLRARQQFVGADNVERVVAAVADDWQGAPPSRVVLAGIGGGGVGAIVHAETVAEAFPDSAVRVLIDGMVVPGRDTFDDCLLATAEDVWGATVPGEGVTAAKVQESIARSTPSALFVVLVRDDDPQLRRLLALTGRECDDARRTLTRAQFRVAVAAMDTAAPRWRIVQIGGTGHSVLDRDAGDPLTQRVIDAIEGRP